jgi:hypothetical protein
LVIGFYVCADKRVEAAILKNIKEELFNRILILPLLMITLLIIKGLSLM